MRLLNMRMKEPCFPISMVGATRRSGSPEGLEATGSNSNGLMAVLWEYGFQYIRWYDGAASNVNLNEMQMMNEVHQLE